MYQAPMKGGLQTDKEGAQSSPADDQPKLKDIIQKLVEFATALVITIYPRNSIRNSASSMLLRVRCQGPTRILSPHCILKAPQATTPPEQPSPSQPSAVEKPPSTTSDQTSFLAIADEKWKDKEEGTLSSGG